MNEARSWSEKLGMHPELTIGYLGLLLLMIGDGVESGFLSPVLYDMHFAPSRVALVFTLYGATAALAAWLSGTLSDLFGPKKVMWVGFLIWVLCEIPFLLIGIAHANYPAACPRSAPCWPALWCPATARTRRSGFRPCSS